jgi:hypothetical protein
MTFLAADNYILTVKILSQKPIYRHLEPLRATRHRLPLSLLES